MSKTIDVKNQEKHRIIITLKTGEIIEFLCNETLAMTVPNVIKRNTSFLAMENKKTAMFVNKDEIRKIEVLKPSDEPRLLSDENMRVIFNTQEQSIKE